MSGILPSDAIQLCVSACAGVFVCVCVCANTFILRIGYGSSCSRPASFGGSFWASLLLDSTGLRHETSMILCNGRTCNVPGIFMQLSCMQHGATWLARQDAMCCFQHGLSSRETCCCPVAGRQSSVQAPCRLNGWSHMSEFPTGSKGLVCPASFVC